MLARQSGFPLRRRRLTVGAALLLGTALTPLPAFAQSGTWNGANGDYHDPNNWVPTGQPADQAAFDANGTDTIDITQPTSIDEFLYTAGAQQYDITILDTLTVNGLAGTGTGIRNLSTFVQTLTNRGTLTFNNASVVGGVGVSIVNDASAGSAALVFNGTSALDSHVGINSIGGSVIGFGTTVMGGSATVAFNDSASADGATMTNFGGGGQGIGTGAFAGTGIGGSSRLEFNGSSHADGATINNLSGSASGFTANNAATAGGTGLGGGATINFNDNSHADNATIFNVSGTTLGSGGVNGAEGLGVGGTSSIIFDDNSHADNAVILNSSLTSTGIGGSGLIGVPAGGDAGADGRASGSIAQIVFNGTSHADGATIENSSGAAETLGGAGGAGDVGAGGTGGNGLATGSPIAVFFNNDSHANGATIINSGGNSLATGGLGGDGGTTGAGGDGGVADSFAVTARVGFFDNAQASGATITNQAGDATALGGDGGIGATLTGNGGDGGNASSTSGAAVLTFAGTSTLGTGATITNTAGDASATGGDGADGGGAGNGGDGGDADATGGAARVTFSENASAGNATIVNTAGTGTILGGNGGDGTIAAGGDGGAAFAVGGNAEILFEGNATAGSATILNNNELPISGTGGTPGADGGGGGAGGQGGGGAVTGASASIIFNDNATGGNAQIENHAGVFFNDDSVFGTIAGGRITNTDIGVTAFSDNASLGSGAIVNGGATSGSTSFFDTSSAGTGTITNQANGHTEFENDSTAGAAAITNQADGILSFSDNATAGAATITNQADGLLFFSDTTTGGSATITNAGTFTIGQSADLVGARVINNAGGAIEIDSTTAGTRIGSLSGNGGTVELGGQPLQLGALNLADNFGGVISGTGALTKVGTGTLVLTGANTYTGATMINAGTLQVDGSITSNTTLLAAARLAGTGTIAGAVVANGTVAPGNAANPAGTLTVNSITFNNGSFLDPTISSGGTSSLLQSIGAITINGGTVRPSAAPGGVFLMQTDYRIAVGGSRTGTFTGLDESQLPTFVDASLFYTATEAFLRVQRNATDFAATAGLTPNQNAISTSLDAAVAANNPLVFTTYLALYNALLASPDQAALQDNLDTVSGDALTVFPIAAQGAAERFGERLTSHTWSDSSNLWGLVAYADQDGDSDGNGPGYDSNGLEFQIGFATSLGPDTRAGLSVGMSNDDVGVNGRVASGDIDSWSVGAHLRHDFGMVYVAGQLTYNWHSIDTTRALLGGGTATADFDAKTWTGAAELGARFAMGRFSLEPYLSLRHASTRQDGYAEAGPAGALVVAAADYDTTRIGVGLRLANRDPAAAIRPYALVSYERELGDEVAALDNDLPGLPAFRVVSTELGQDVFTARLGVEATVSGGVSLFAGGSGRWRSNENSVQAEGGVRIRF